MHVVEGQFSHAMAFFLDSSIKRQKYTSKTPYLLFSTLSAFLVLYK